jgi:tRNA A-37 threonylcarbamoyl transferase component Bud32
MLPLSPTRLGRYEIVDEIGKGAMGIVYLARDPLIGRLVALKTFRIGYSIKDAELEQFRARFIREAQSAGILSHPNIVTIHDVVERGEEGLAFIAMEYVNGTNLKSVLQEPRRPALAYVGEILGQIADGLDYAHSCKVIHRDIKPANILITTDSRVKITDFGIARLGSSNLTQEGQLLGTPNYMSPEQILGRDVDHRADIFSLGVVLYEMITLHKPFQGDNLTVVSHRIVYDHFTPAREHARDLPPGTEQVLARALEKDPTRRYQRARDLADDFERVVGGGAARDRLNETQGLSTTALLPLPLRHPAAAGSQTAPTATLPRGGAASAVPGASVAPVQAAGRSLAGAGAPAVDAAGPSLVPLAAAGAPLPGAGAASMAGMAATWPPPGGAGAGASTAPRRPFWRRLTERRGGVARGPGVAANAAAGAGMAGGVNGSDLAGVEVPGVGVAGVGAAVTDHLDTSSFWLRGPAAEAGVPGIAAPAASAGSVGPAGAVGSAGAAWTPGTAGAPAAAAAEASDASPGMPGMLGMPIAQTAAAAVPTVRIVPASPAARGAPATAPVPTPHPTPAGVLGLDSSPAQAVPMPVPSPPQAAQTAPPPPRPALRSERLGLPAPRRLAVLVAAGIGLGLLIAGGLELWTRTWPAGPAAPRGGPAAERSAATDTRVKVLELIREGRRRLEAGDPEGAAAAFRATENLLPGRPGLRRRREEAERLQNDRRQRLDQQRTIASKLDEGRLALADRRYEEAEAAAQAVLTMSPGNTVAEEILAEVKKGRTRSRDRASSSARLAALAATAVPAAARPEAAAGRGDQAAAPALEARDATLELAFFSHLPAGTLMVLVNGNRVLTESFRFYEKSGLFRSRPTTGWVRRSLSVKPGNAEIRIYVTVQGSAAVVKTVRGNLPAGATRRLDVQLADSGEVSLQLN